MRIEIDQSIKIEQTNKITSIACSNGISRSVGLSSTAKKEIENYFRSTGNRKMFIIFTFCALVYLVLHDLITPQTDIYIDREYPGYDNLIKDKLVTAFKKLSKKNIDKHHIHIVQIGRSSRAHNLAWLSAKNNSFNFRYNSKNIIKIIKQI